MTALTSDERLSQDAPLSTLGGPLKTLQAHARGKSPPSQRSAVVLRVNSPWNQSHRAERMIPSNRLRTRQGEDVNARVRLPHGAENAERRHDLPANAWSQKLTCKLGKRSRTGLV